MNPLEDVIAKAKEKIESELTDIENREDITEDEKISRIINRFSIFCAAVAVQPIPFADIFVLTPIQAYMGVRLSAIKGMPISDAEATDMVKEIAGVVGMGLLAQQTALGLYKVGLPFLAGFTTIPLVYGLTYAIGQIMVAYLDKKSRKEVLSKTDMKDIWNRGKAKAKKEARKATDEVKKTASEL